MKKSLFKTAFLSFLFLLFAFPASGEASYDCKGGTGCGSNIYSCDSSVSDCSVSGNWTVYTACSSLEKCVAGQSSCSPSGSCLDAPTLVSPTDRQGIDDEEKKIPLPLTIDWNDVTGASYYRYKIYKPSGELEFSGGPVANSSTTVYSHILQSDTIYSWQARACLDSLSESSCGPFSSSWSFKTNWAPQPISPQPDSTSNVAPIVFQWSENPEAKSYVLYFLNKKAAIAEIFLKRKDLWSFWCCTSRMCPSQIPLDPNETEPQPTATEAAFDVGIFTRESDYMWAVSACMQENCSQCGKKCGEKDVPVGEEGDPGVCRELSSEGVQTFKTGNLPLSVPTLKQPVYRAGPPEEIPTVNLYYKLNWLRVPGAMFYKCEIRDAETGKLMISKDDFYGDDIMFKLEDVWPSQVTFELNKTYTWRITSCWMGESWYSDYVKKCKDSTSEPDKWSETWKFKTTGAPPTNLSPYNGESDVQIPVKFNWADVPGAMSYRYQFSSNSNFSDPKGGLLSVSEISVDYPRVNQKSNYWWRVKSCADSSGDICGNWSNVNAFTTLTLKAPTVFYPGNNGNLLTSDRNLRWDPAPSAKFYQYTVDYDSNNPPAEEQNQTDCKNMAGTKVKDLTIISSNVAYISYDCLGKYVFHVKSCLDKDCNEPSDDMTITTFNLVQDEEAAKEKSIVPCGRYYDNPDTPWNERDTCQLEHVFILINNILDFILWKVGLIAIVVLAIITAITFYFSIGSTQALITVKSMLRNAGIGYLIMFLAWGVINLIIIIFGYKTATFGEWWRLHF